MAKQLNVDLTVRANTNHAREEMKKLQQDLHAIMNISLSDKNLSAGFEQAATAAKELTYHLNQAYNSSTGNLDLSKFNASLRKSNTDVTQLSNKLLQAGSIGQSAFVNLANAISQAEYPMFKLNSKLAEMWTTLKNTARWQLSSSMLHGFMGAVQKATSYAQDLDKSLNDIRIVTNMTSENMDDFAEKANKAAKELSTTTKAYSDASLIFFQQGLSRGEVEERTNITMKMSQAAGEDAAEVSSYMTAIWNNFEKGGRSLESFADSMTRLGADTAASSAEIATGLEKFVSIGETVGLSFDYAASAVTTIIDQTREAPETVGTALKTIFARLQGLKLGDTLEDGVDLNKYSKALSTVGVQVLDMNGELRDADDILLELGNKWDTLNRAQQTALAQTVAGTRQYTHLMSLMNNFDDFLVNVDKSANAEGTLDQQAAIYADSWEGAKKRVQAALESIYNSLLDRDLMKEYNNILADILTGIDQLIDGAGGLKGVIASVGSFALAFISHKIQPAIQNMVLNIKNLFTSTQDQARNLVSSFQSNVTTQINSGNYDPSQTQSLKNSSTLAEARARLTVVSKRLTEQEAQLYQLDISNLELQAKKAQAIADSIAALDKQIGTLIISADVTESNTEATRVYNNLLKEQRDLSQQAFDRATSADGTNDDYQEYFAAEAAISELQDRKLELNETLNASSSAFMTAYEGMQRNTMGAEELAETITKAKVPWEELLTSLQNSKITNDSLPSFKSSLEMIYQSMPSIIKQSKPIQQALQAAFNASNPIAFKDAIKSMVTALKGVKIEGKDVSKALMEMNPKAFKELEILLKRIQGEEKELISINESLNKSLKDFDPKHIVSGVEKLSSAASIMGQVAMMGNSISTMISSWSNTDMSFGEKLTTTFMSLSMIIPGMISSLTAFGTVLEGTAAKETILSFAMRVANRDKDIAKAKTILLTKAKGAELAEDQTATIVKGALAAAIKAEGIAVDANTLKTMKKVTAQMVANGATQEEIAGYIASKLTCDADTAAKIANKIATESLKTSIYSLLWPIGLVIAAITALVTAFKLWEQHEEEVIERTRELHKTQASTAAETFKNQKQEQENVNALYREYINAQNALDGSEESKNALKSATDKLCEALGVEWGALDRLSGKYDEINKKMLEAQKNSLKETLTKAETVINANDYVIKDRQDEMFEEDPSDGTSVTIGPLLGVTDNVAIKPTLGTTNTDEEEVRDAWAKFLEENYSDSIDKFAGPEELKGQTVYLKEGVTEADAVAMANEFYEYLINNKEEAGVDDDILAESEMFGWFQKLYSDEDLAAYRTENDEAQNTIDSSILELANINTQLETETNVSSVETEEQYKEYAEAYKKQLQDLAEQYGAKIDDYDQAVEDYLSQFANLGTIQNETEIMSDVKKEAPKSISDSTLDSMATEYEDFYTIIGQVDFDKVKSEEQLRETLNELQDVADLETLEKQDLGIDLEEFQAYKDLLAETHPELKKNRKALNDVAVANKRMEKGVKTLADDWEDFDGIMSDSNSTIEDVSSVLPDINEGLKDILNVSDEQFELLPPDFAKKNWGLIQDVVNGVEGAVDELRNKAGEEMLLNIGAKVDADGDGSVDAAFMEIHNAIAAYDNMDDFTVGVAIDPAKHAEFIANCESLINAAGMTAEQAQAYFASMGYDVELEEVKPKSQDVSKYSYYELDEAATEKAGGVPQFKKTPTEIPVTTEASATAYAVKTITPNGSYGGGTGVNTTAPKSATSDKGGGGGSKPKKTSDSRKNKSEMVDRYKEINDQLEETGRQMNKNTTLADGLWGEKRLAMLRKNIKLMKQERKELDEKLKLSRKYLKEDKNNLKKQAGQGNSTEAKEQREALGMTVNFKFDDDGYITNYTSEMTKLYNKRETLLKSFGSTMDENEQKKLEEFDKAFDNLKTAYEQYEQTMDERDDLEEEKMQKKLEQQEAYLDLLNEEADLKDQINEAELEFIEYYLSKVEDDMFSQVEGLGYMGQQANIYAGNLQNQESLYKDLTKALKNGDINEPQYKQAMQEMQSVTIENLQALQESKKAMQDYYGNTLAMAQEELAAFTDQMEHLNSVFDHYTSLLDLLGKRKNFTVSGQVLMGKANNVKNELDVYREEYEMYSKEADKWEKKMLKAEIGSNKYETYKKNWEAAQQAANEAQENMLAKTEEWAEAMRAVVENNLQGLAAELEATLTNGSNFDTILNSMERANNLQEEYLTATNKIYETNKLMRTAQQEIDKTSNEVAKRRMKEFIAETKQLQNQGQLSKYELEIQQAKYDLLLAEIALEEAQNAKSTVRLQRDSEGNFGYVYTADSSKTAEAEQKMADAQNRLYNIGLEGANDYNQKYTETMSELYNDLAELQQQYLEGQFATEDEYQAAVEASKKYHYDKLKQYSSLYQVALTTDSRVVADAWSTDFNDMIYKTEEWTSAINDYTDKAASELAVWAETVNTVISGSGLDNIDSELEKMAEESEKLKNVLVGDDGLIEAIKEQVKEVGKLSQKYLKVQAAIDKVIESYEKFLGKVNKKFTGTTGTGATTITLPTPQGYDTGGYTGEWGSWGKLAMLHEKEMVLNKEDTSNLLKTMEFLDNIIKTIDLQATNAALGGLLSSPSFGGLDQHDVLEQNVKIEASFPNVSNRAEIEEAFETLVNRASQYANRK